MLMEYQGVSAPDILCALLKPCILNIRPKTLSLLHTWRSIMHALLCAMNPAEAIETCRADVRGSAFGMGSFALLVMLLTPGWSAGQTPSVPAAPPASSAATTPAG